MGGFVKPQILALDRQGGGEVAINVNEIACIRADAVAGGSTLELAGSGEVIAVRQRPEQLMPRIQPCPFVPFMQPGALTGQPVLVNPGAVALVEASDDGIAIQLRGRGSRIAVAGSLQGVVERLSMPVRERPGDAVVHRLSDLPARMNARPRPRAASPAQDRNTDPKRDWIWVGGKHRPHP